MSRRVKFCTISANMAYADRKKNLRGRENLTIDLESTCLKQFLKFMQERIIFCWLLIDLLVTLILQVYQAMGKLHEANDDYSQILEDNNSDPSLYMHRGSVLFLLEVCCEQLLHWKSWRLCTELYIPYTVSEVGKYSRWALVLFFHVTHGGSQKNLLKPC